MILAKKSKIPAGHGAANIAARHLPGRKEILDFISDNPERSGKREIAKAFGLKGQDRIWLKDLLRGLTDEGVIDKRRKRNLRHGALPPVALLDIFGRDDDGNLLAHPAEWEDSAPPTIEIRPSRQTDAPTAGVGERILAKIFASKDDEGPAYHGRIIRKIDKRAQSTLGVLRHLENGEWQLEPIDRRQNALLIDPQSLHEAKAGDLVDVNIGEDRRYGLKRGMVRQVVGRVDSEKALSMIAIFSHGIPHIFPQDVLDEAEAAKPVTLSDGREDWRNLALVTIDPPDAKDHDDAVFAESDPDTGNPGGHIIVVAIADVAAYVRPGSALDREAEKRGNSVYFPDRVVPMLPERISNDLCSLREGEERPALAVRMIYDAHGHKLKHSFHRIMMRSVAKLAYEQAQKAIEGMVDEKTTPILDTVLKPLWDAYGALKQARNNREPLDLDLPEKKILLDADGRVQNVYEPVRLDAHRLIEEFMIAANVAAAETLKKADQPFIYRIHDQPSLAKQESLRDFLHSLGMPLARGVDLTPAKFNAILNKVKGSDKQDLVNQVILRSQAQAEYKPQNIGHFGLSLKNYAHFTSPIRRYADLIVHRALIKALKLGNDGLRTDQEEQLDEISSEISVSERRAMAAERETIDRLIAHYLSDKVGAQFEGRIAGVTKSGLFVNLETYGADGFIPISTLGNEYFHFDESRHALLGERSRKGYQMGDIVTVRLVEALPIAGALRFEMLTSPHPLPFSTVSHHKAGRHSRSHNPARSRTRKR